MCGHGLGGYPGSYKKGLPISGLDKVRSMRDAFVFHAGTAAADEGVVASGGRVLGVTALGDTVQDAIRRAYRAVSDIRWDDVCYRTDIGKKALTRLEAPPRVGIVMGSDSDVTVMDSAVGIMKKFGIPFDLTVASAHRSPQKAMAFAATARERGIQVLIAGAGHAAHLAGVIAAHTPLPVIGVPIDSSCLQGLDSLLSTVQMPPGVPVATMALGKPGAKNAGILAAQIIALSDPELAEKLDAFKAEMARQVEKKAEELERII
ncbi:phosphoribosylamine--glycine ligase [Desulfonema ishimotonii]|uniref:N5-carboxyaminoimidazole ribonucleotide mutase n=1 Tax=Desulfonema ishimotonii TaxID=45657 RepID=A0A401G189_9BACT|nr:phosphoribosylamine--glycine ligase [Desulfonema ishimotonii]